MCKRLNIFMILLLYACINLYAEIQLTPFISTEDSQRVPNASKVLYDKLGAIITLAGYTVAPEQSSRFILAAHISEASKDVIGTAPTRIAYVLKIVLCIGDGVSGTCFKQMMLKSKGVGETEDKAYMNALKNLKTNGSAITSFIQDGAKRIVEYYESSKNDILSSANQDLVACNFDEAAYTLSLVPSECSYYPKACDMLVTVYKEKKEYESAKHLNMSKSIWGASQDKNSAEEALGYLAQVDPSSSCYKDAVSLGNKITQTVANINAKEWEEHVKEQKHQREMEIRDLERKQEQDKLNAQIREKQIKAARDVAVAYYQSRPRVYYYRVYGWW